MARLTRRVERLAAHLDPVPDPPFLPFARAVVAWSGGEPSEERAHELALAWQQTGRGLPWTTPVARLRTASG